MGPDGYILEKYDNMTGAYTCRRLVEEAEALGMKVDILGVQDTWADRDGIYNRGRRLESRDFVINRYKPGILKRQISALAERVYNPQDVYEQYLNKYEQVKNLTSEAFLMPRYILAAAGIGFGTLKEKLGSPVVAKGLESSMGAEISLVSGEEDLQDLIHRYGPDKEYLFEEFIETSYGRDLRFYSIRGQVQACMVRQSRGDFRANVALGAGVESHEITPGMEQIARDIYRQTGLDFLGIDLLFGKDLPYFCEINVMPGIEGIEKASGRNVARAIMETIRGDFEG